MLGSLFLGFNREVSENLVPSRFKGRRCVLVSRVLPMGYANSVATAQHIHRNAVRLGSDNAEPALGGEGEMRKDRAMSNASTEFISTTLTRLRGHGRSCQRYSHFHRESFTFSLLFKGLHNDPYFIE